MTDRDMRRVMGDEWTDSVEARERRVQNQLNRNQKALGFSSRGEFDKALKIWAELAEEGLEMMDPYMGPAKIYRKLKQYDDEIRICRQGIAFVEGVMVKRLEDELRKFEADPIQTEDTKAFMRTWTANRINNSLRVSTAKLQARVEKAEALKTRVLVVKILG